MIQSGIVIAKQIILFVAFPVKCSKPYVGHTKRTLRERMCEHFRFISQYDNSHSVVRHSNDPDHNDLQDLNTHVLQFGQEYFDSEESLAISLIL